MFEVNLICRCDHVPCGAERLVRVSVKLSRPLSPDVFSPAFDVNLDELSDTLRAAGWKLVFGTRDRHRERVLCPTHKDQVGG